MLTGDENIDDLVFSELRREVASHTFATVIGAQREGIMNAVAASTRERAREFRIEVIDVRIKRADLPREVLASVFARMQAEREREAKRYRSEGEEEAAKLRAETDKERTIIQADAEQKAQRFRGEGDAAAAEIYAQAYSKNPEFYGFMRSLQAYEQFLRKRSTLLLSADSTLFRYLGRSQPVPEEKLSAQ
jgi:modulator of FtsH protease HflC